MKETNKTLSFDQDAIKKLKKKLVKVCDEISDFRQHFYFIEAARSDYDGYTDSENWEKVQVFLNYFANIWDKQRVIELYQDAQEALNELNSLPEVTQTCQCLSHPSKNGHSEISSHPKGGVNASIEDVPVKNAVSSRGLYPS